MDQNDTESRLHSSEDFSLSLVGGVALCGLALAAIFLIFGADKVATWMAAASAVLLTLSLGSLFVLRRCPSFYSHLTHRHSVHMRASHDPPPKYRHSWGRAYAERAKATRRSSQGDVDFEELERHLEGIPMPPRETKFTSLFSTSKRGHQRKGQNTARNSSSSSSRGHSQSLPDHALRRNNSSSGMEPSLTVRQPLDPNHLPSSSGPQETQINAMQCSTLSFTHDKNSVIVPSSAATTDLSSPQSAAVDMSHTDALPTYSEILELRADALLRSVGVRPQREIINSSQAECPRQQSEVSSINAVDET